MTSTQASGVRKEPRPFNLVRWFLLVGMISISATSAGTAYVLSRVLADNMLDRDAMVTYQFVNSVLNTEQARAYFATGAENDPENRVFFERFFAELSKIPDVLRANAYDVDRRILWSSNPELIGVEFPTNHELDEAFEGAIISEEGNLGEIRKAEHAFLEGLGDTFIENYLPISDAAGEIIGVVEVYKSPTTVYSAIDRGVYLVWACALAAGLMLYLALYWIIRQGNQVIEGQHRRLAMAEAMAAVGELASAVAHGLRNPLASIRSSAEVSLSDDPPPPVRQSLNDIIEQSDRLDLWIRELLSTATAGGEVFESLSVEPLLRNSLKTYAIQIEQLGIDPSLEIERNLPPVHCNSVALSQVINSLVANALEAMPEGGSLWLGAKMVEQKGAVEISVGDNGPGLTAEQSSRLFQPLATTKTTGLGVGLPLAKRIIERQGGHLRIQSQSGIGTKALITLPTRV